MEPGQRGPLPKDVLEPGQRGPLPLESDVDKGFFERIEAGCTMIVPADGEVFMILLTVPAGDTILYNLLIESDVITSIHFDHA